MKIKNRSDTFTWSMLTRLCAPFLLELLVFKEIQRSICVVLTLNTYKSDHNPYNSIFTFYFLKYIINGLHQLQNYGKSAFDAGPQNPVKKKTHVLFKKLCINFGETEIRPEINIFCEDGLSMLPAISHSSASEALARASSSSGSSVTLSIMGSTLFLGTKAFPAT